MHKSIAHPYASIQADLRDAGFVINYKKSNLMPHRSGKWLGILVDLDAGCFHVPEDKITRLMISLSRILHPARVPVRAVASTVGQIMSMNLLLLISTQEQCMQ